MRGADEQTSHMFSYLSPEQRVRPRSRPNSTPLHEWFEDDESA